MTETYKRAAICMECWNYQEGVHVQKPLALSHLKAKHPEQQNKYERETAKRKGSNTPPVANLFEKKKKEKKKFANNSSKPNKITNNVTEMTISE